jgi:hypothetical protein
MFGLLPINDHDMNQRVVEINFELAKSKVKLRICDMYCPYVAAWFCLCCHASYGCKNLGSSDMSAISYEEH